MEVGVGAGMGIVIVFEEKRVCVDNDRIAKGDDIFDLLVRKE